jgi:hypothetical protein
MQLQELMVAAGGVLVLVLKANPVPGATVQELEERVVLGVETATVAAAVLARIKVVEVGAGAWGRTSTSNSSHNMMQRSRTARTERTRTSQPTLAMAGIMDATLAQVAV